MWPASGNQWSLNPAAYQNIPYEQVDWATLAQQWIKMKETLPSGNAELPPPPAPQISKINENQPSKPTPTPVTTPAPASSTIETQPVNDIEGGEAPMDMDTKDDDVSPVPIDVAAGSDWNKWNNWQSQWNWGWPGNAGTVPLNEKSPSTTLKVDNKVKSLSNDSNPVLNNYANNLETFLNDSATSTSQVSGSFGYDSVASGTIPPHQKSGYWTKNAYSLSGKSTTDEWSKGSKALPKTGGAKSVIEQFSVMDAAKKKKLPAWIRDGLNKMEREKQKKMEQDRIMHEKYMRDQIPEDEMHENNIIKDSIVSPANNSAVFEEAEISPPNRNEESRSPVLERPSHHQRASSTNEDTNVIRKTKDQIMEESMLKVRRILTEFLLEATENQVALIAKEELRKKKSASAQQIRKSNALTSLTGNLGLNVYDSDSESSASEREKDDRGIDSDEELESLIEKKKRDFALVEDEIERDIENKEHRERQMVERDNDDDNDEDNRSSKVREKDNHGSPRSHENSSKRSRRETLDHSTSNSQTDTVKSNSAHSNKLNGNNSESSTKNHSSKSDKAKKKSRSRSSSSSSSSSSRSSSESSSSGRSRSESNSNSSGSRYSKKKRKRKSRKKQVVEKESKRSKHRSKSRSRSRSRYSRGEKKYAGSKNSSREETKEKKRSHDHRRSSPGRHRQSPSYRRDSKDSSSSKYKDSRRRESSDSRRKRQRSSSRDRRYSSYKRR